MRSIIALFILLQLPSIPYLLAGTTHSSCKKAAEEEILPSLPQETTFQAINGEIVLSVLSEKEVKRTFKRLQEAKHIPHRYILNGCYARAYEMNHLMETWGIHSAKIFVNGEDLQFPTKLTKEGKVSWSSHAAPLVLQRSKSQGVAGGIPASVAATAVPMVLDPGLFKEPVTIEKWLAALTRHLPRGTKSTFLHDLKFDDFPVVHFFVDQYTFDTRDILIRHSKGLGPRKDWHKKHLELSSEQNAYCLQLLEGMKIKN